MSISSRCRITAGSAIRHFSVCPPGRPIGCTVVVTLTVSEVLRSHRRFIAEPVALS